MAIRQKQYCDICESFLGEGNEGAEIIKEKGQSSFPQLTWVFHKLGNAIYKRQDGKPVLIEQWQGKPNRLEFCNDHAAQLNTLLKAFCKNDYRLMDLLDELVVEDEKTWSEKQEKIKKDFFKCLEEFNKNADRD